MLAAMITVKALDKNTGKISDGHKPARIDQLCARDATVVWVDVSDPTDEDFRRLAEEFHFHPLSIEDSRHAHQRPKVEEYSGYYFIVLYEARRPEPGRTLELAELDIFLGRNYLVTVHSQSINAIATAARLWPEWLDRAEPSAGLLAYLLIDAIVDDYLPILDEMSERMDELEDEIFGDFDQTAIREIFFIKKQLVFMRRAVAPLRDVFNTLLRREQPIFEREIFVYYQDVFDHLIRVADTIDSLRDLLGSTMDAYLSISGNRMNVVMKRLTSISTILMSVTLIAGIYGMNFDHMPELHWQYGYVFALSAMVVIGVAIFVYLRKIDWL
jgi:magnesium transporter